jgi:hypothetical protein
MLYSRDTVDAAAEKVIVLTPCEAVTKPPTPAPSDPRGQDQ